ncbi:MAG: hypothetical protein GTO02_09850 [Candidatus Dadabacteria bacterium]|nr:hypothetical protein [Candidatus Dadabacteria bacterium]
MTTKELLRTLGETKGAKAFELARNPPPPPAPPPLPVINWKERTAMKNTLIIKHLKILGGIFALLFAILVLPVMTAFPEIGKSMLMGLPPMLFIAFSWMVGAWYAWDKEFYIFIGLTLGAMPLRLGVGMLWAIFVMKIPEVHQLAFVLGMMIFWVAFTCSEFIMLLEFSNKLPKDGRQHES